MKKILSAIFLLLALSLRLPALTLASPDGQLTATLETDASGALRYAVARAGTVIIEPSRMGVTVDGTDWGGAVAIGRVATSRIDESYAMFGGKSRAINRANVATVTLTQAGTRREFTVELRAFDDGFAWRMILPGTEGEKRRVNGEASAWKLPAGSRIWFGERNNDWKLKSYAGAWISAPIEQMPTVSSQGPVQGPPLVAQLPEGGYALLTEAALANYSGLRLRATGDRTFTADFTEGKKGFELAGPIVTPWRVVLVNADLNGLVNNDVILNLNSPPDPRLFADTSYIKPGRAVWRWWSRDTGLPAEEMQFVDYAAELGFEYTLVDSGWEKWPDPWNDLARIVAHGRERNVGVLVWKHSNELGDPADNWAQMRTFFDGVRKSGAAGVKIDYFNAESLDRVVFQLAALRLAAERRLLVDFHGIQKPTGEARTWPNEITREGIRGMELNNMSEGPLPASHNAALPFTRFVVGAGDYTPLGYSRPGPTTWAHQLATVVQFHSPLQVIAEDPEVLLHHPATQPALEVLKAIPSVWEETRVLPASRIGELSLIARRSGANWFLAVLNGRPEPVEKLEVGLAFLGAGRYHAIRLTSPARNNFSRDEFESTREAKLTFALSAGDGAVVMFQPVSAGSAVTTATSAPAIPAPAARLAATDRDSALDLSGDWLFALDPLDRGEALGWPALDKGELPKRESWDAVKVPHDFLSDPRYAYTGVAWYSRAIQLPTLEWEKRSWRIEFDAVFQRCRVWLNGELLGAHEGGYTPFNVVVPPGLLRAKRNLLIVAVDNRIKLHALPGARSGNSPTNSVYPWLNYGGILGGVRLASHAPVWIERQKVDAQPQADGSALLRITATVHNDRKIPVRTSLTAEITDEAGRVLPLKLSGEMALQPDTMGEIQLAGTVPARSYERWDLDSPRLYRSRVRLGDAAEASVHETQFGFRTLSIEAGQFLLNGRAMRLAGANRARGHPVGGGIDSDAIVAEDLSLMKAAGLRFSRLQHTAPGENVLDWADRHGLLLILEVGAWGHPAADLASEELRAQFRREMGELMQLAWNHPSVVGWSLGNEYESWTPEGVAWTKDMAAWVKGIDATRPVTFAAIGRALRELSRSPAGAEAFDCVDFISTNLYFPAAEAARYLDSLHARWPGKPVYVSEFGLRTDKVAAEQERIDHFEAMLALIQSRPWICGLSFWSFNDYASRYPGSGADGYRRWGLVDEFRKPRELYRHAAERLSHGLDAPSK